MYRWMLEYPVERLNYMLEDSAPIRVVLTQGASSRAVECGAGEAVRSSSLADASQWKDQADDES